MPITSRLLLQQLPSLIVPLTIISAATLVVFSMSFGRMKLKYYYYSYDNNNNNKHFNGTQNSTLSGDERRSTGTGTGLLLLPLRVEGSAGIKGPIGSTKTTTARSSEQDVSTDSDGMISFPALIRSHVMAPQITRGNLNPFLFNGHLQTLNTVVPWQSEPAVPVYYGRRVFEHQDARFVGSFTVDFVVGRDVFLGGVEGERDEGGEGRPALPSPTNTRYLTSREIEGMDDAGGARIDDDRPMLVVLHGLSGGSHELYLRHVIARLLVPLGDGRDGAGKEGQEWEVCVVNSRGCANSQLTSSLFYNARATWDLRQTVRWLRETFPNRPLFALGFSLGANILANYLGEEGERCEFRAAMLISNPWNLDVGSVALQRSWLGLHVYSRAMGTNMKKLFEKHIPQISKNPRVDVEKIMTQCRYLHEFDRDVQGPAWGYPTEGAYYRDASSSDSLLAIRIPFFALHAVDDPIAVDEVLPRQEFEQTPYGVLCTTSLGGHLGWFELGGGRWFSRVAENFFRTMASDIDLSRPPIVDGNVHDTAQQEAWRSPFEPMRRKLRLGVDA